MTDDLTGLLRAVIENHDDDHVRLVYADALDELPTHRVKCHVCGGTGSHSLDPYALAAKYGTHTAGKILDESRCGVCQGTGEVVDTFPQERAELIRVQCELVRTPKQCVLCIGPLFKATKKHQFGGTCPVCTDEVYCPYHGLVARETFLLEQLQRRGLLTGREDYHRGFIRTWTGTADEWFKVEGKLFWHGDQTVQKIVKCTDCDGDGWQHHDKNGHHTRTKCWNPLCEKGSIKFEKVPRPLPPSAHPLRRVVLTTMPPLDNLGESAHREWVEHCREKWPELDILIPSTLEGTEVVSDDDEDYIPDHALPNDYG